MPLPGGGVNGLLGIGGCQIYCVTGTRHPEPGSRDVTLCHAGHEYHDTRDTCTWHTETDNTDRRMWPHTSSRILSNKIKLSWTAVQLDADAVRVTQLATQRRTGLAPSLISS